MGREPRTFGLKVKFPILFIVDTPPIESQQENHFNACPDVLVLGSNPQIEFSYFSIFPLLSYQMG